MSKRRGNRRNQGQNGQPKVIDRYRHADPLGNSDRVDPARNFPNMPPNLGRDVVPHIFTFQGLVSSLARTYRNPDEAVKNSLDNARFMRNDIGIMECLEQRQRATSLLDWHVVVDGPEMPHHKSLKDRLTRILRSTPRFTEYRRWLLEALWFGRSGIQHRYGYKFRENGERDIVVSEWLPIHGDKLVFRQDDGSYEHPRCEVGLRVNQLEGSTELIQGRRIIPTETGQAVMLAPFERKLVAIHKHMIEDAAYEDPLSNGSIHGIGIRSRIYWEWFQKQELMALFVEYLERSALGFEIWYYDSSNPQAEAKVKEAAENRIGRRNIILFPKTPGDDTHSYGVERFEPNAAGAEAFQNLLNNYFGHRIKRYILGQILTSEVEGTGLGSGVADLHLQTMLDIVKYDSTNLEETVTREKLEYLKQLNCPNATNVECRFVIQTQSPDTENKLAGFQKAYEMGARLKESDVMEAIGAAIPGPEDVVLQKDGGKQESGDQTSSVAISDSASSELVHKLQSLTGKQSGSNRSAGERSGPGSGRLPEIGGGRGGVGGQKGDGADNPIDHFSKSGTIDRDTLAERTYNPGWSYASA